jgi:hypothetical protein
MTDPASTTVALGTFTPVNSRAQLPHDIDRWLPPGAGLVVTPELTTLIGAGPLALRRRRIVAVDGSAGTGKSTAVAALAASASAEVVRVNAKPKSTGREFMRSFHEALTGVADPGGTQWQLETKLKVLLAAKPRVAIFDEVQNVGLPALQALYFLLNLPTGQWGLVLAGKGLMSMLAREQMLDSRVGLRVTMPKLSGDRLLDVLRELHPVLRDASPQLLGAIDMAWGRGNLREWTKFLEWVLDLAPGLPLDVATAEQAIELMAGKPVALRLAAVTSRRA